MNGNVFVFYTMIAIWIFYILVAIFKKVPIDENFGTKQTFEHWSGWGLAAPLVTIAIVATTMFSYLPEEKGTMEQHYLYMKSLKNQMEVQGDFTLFSGSIDSKEYYYFYWQSTEGLVRGKVPVNETYIIETDSRKPEIMEIYTTYDNSGYFKWNPGPRTEGRRYKMYVPTNTVIKEFKVY